MKPGIYNGLQRISIPLFGVLSTALLAHKALTKADMGVWVNFLAVTSFIELFRSGIVRTSLIKYINYSQFSERGKVMSAAFFLNVVVSIVAGMLLYFTAGPIQSFLRSPGLEFMLHFFIFTLFILIFFSHIEWLMYGHSMFRSLFITYVVRQGSTLLAILGYFLFMGKISLPILVMIYTGGVALGLITGFIMTRSLFQMKLRLEGSWVLRLWNFGKYVFGSNMGTLVFRNADQFLLSNITANPGIVASQNISVRIINIADIPSQVIADVLFPKSSNPDMLQQPGRIKYFYEKAVGASLSVIIPFILFIILFPKFIILLLAGREYFDAIPYLRLISLAALFLAFLKQWGVIIDSTGRPYINFIVLMLMAGLEIFFCYFFIERFQLKGAAFALLSTHLMGFIITQLLLRRYFNINFMNCFKYAWNFYPEMFNLIAMKFFNKKNSK